MDLWQAMSAGLVGLCIGLVLVALARLPDSRLIRPLFYLILTVALCSLGELVASHADNMTRKRVDAKGTGMVFADVAEAHRAFETGAVDLHAAVKVRIREVVEDDDGELQERTLMMDTTVGRALLSEIMPDGLPFALVNNVMNKKAISGLINACYRRVGLKETVVSVPSCVRICPGLVLSQKGDPRHNDHRETEQKGGRQYRIDPRSVR